MRIFVDEDGRAVTVQWESRGALTVLRDDDTVTGRFSPPWGSPVYDSDAPSPEASEAAIWEEAHARGVESGIEQERAEAKRREAAPGKTVDGAMRAADRLIGEILEESA